MGLEFKLSDRELPVSPVFVRFLAQVLRGLPFEREIWAEQRSESLSVADLDLNGVAAAAALIMGSASGRERLARAYTLLFSLLTGEMSPLSLRYLHWYSAHGGVVPHGGTVSSAGLGAGARTEWASP